jgi:hypothetical protein
VVRDFTACRHRRDLQAPATAKDRDARLACGLHDCDLVGHGKVLIIGVERRAADHHPVIISEVATVGRPRLGIGGVEDVDFNRGKMRGYRLGINPARCAKPLGRGAVAPLARVTR